MPRPVLYRIDLALLRDKSDTDKAQVPLGPAVVSFFLQGATSSNTSGVTVPTGSSTIEVFDIGDVMAGDVVQAGVDGTAITVTAVDSPTLLTVSNGGAAFTLNPRTRLIMLTRRPELYSDPLGTAPIGPNLLSDATGRAQGYISRSRYDYIVQANTRDKAELVSASSGSGAAVNALTWNHASSGSDRILFVAVTLAPAPDEAIIESVTYAGIRLTFVGETANLKLYRLFEPPVGTYPVVVQLTPSSSGNVVGGAVTAAGVDPTTFIAPAAATGSSSLTSVTLNSVAAKSMTFAMVAVADQSTGVSVTSGSSQTERWDATAGTSVPTIVTSAGATKEIPGAGNQALGFILSESRPWQTLATELRYLSEKLSLSRLYIDAVGGTQPSPAWVNARDFSTIQAAIDSLPATGGVVYAPSGTYNVTTTTIPENKPVHLMGDGADRTILFCADPELDILRIESSLTTIENLTIKGPYLVPSEPNIRGRGVVIGIPGNTIDALRRVSIIGCRIVDTASWALYLRGTGDSVPVDPERLLIWGQFERTDFQHNRTGGLVEVRVGNNGNAFKNCSFTQFHGPALNAFGASSLSLQTCTFEDKLDDAVAYVMLDSDNNVLLDSCWFEQHFSEDLTKPFIHVGVANACHEVAIHNCRFVRQTGDLPRLIQVDSNSKGVSIVNPTCHMVKAPKLFALRVNGPDDEKDINIVGQSEVYLSGAVITSDVSTIPAVVVASATGVVTAGLGPRTTPPHLSETQRDDPLSLALDRKHGDTIYNTNLERLQEWSGTDWLPVRVTPSGTGDNVTGTVYSGTGLARVSAYVTRSGAGTVELKIEWTDSVGARSATIALAPSPGSDFAQGQLVVTSEGAVTYRVINPLLVPWQVTISAEQI